MFCNICGDGIKHNPNDLYDQLVKHVISSHLGIGYYSANIKSLAIINIDSVYHSDERKNIDAGFMYMLPHVFYLDMKNPILNSLQSYSGANRDSKIHPTVYTKYEENEYTEFMQILMNDCFECVLCGAEYDVFPSYEMFDEHILANHPEICNEYN